MRRAGPEKFTPARARHARQHGSSLNLGVRPTATARLKHSRPEVARSRLTSGPCLTIMAEEEEGFAEEAHAEEEEQVLIALPTVRTPPRADAARSLVAVAVLTRTRASEILRQMEAVKELATKWAGVFKLCAFDGNTFYVPAEYAPRHRGGGQFVVLDANYTTPEIAELVRPQIGIIPGAVIWEAFDEQNRFGVTTIELSAEVLRAVAVGGILSPGTVQNAGYYTLPAEPMLVPTPEIEEVVM